jgi:hypothetical protein
VDRRRERNARLRERRERRSEEFRLREQQGLSSLGTEEYSSSDEEEECRGQPSGSPKKRGESCVKPAKNKSKMHLLPKHAHKARPTLRWPPQPTEVAQTKSPRAGSTSLEG